MTSPVDRPDRAEKTPDGGIQEVAPDLAYQRLAIVNVVYFGAPNAADRKWVLVDTGVVGTSGMISRAAEKRFGSGSRPAAIIITHAHFDHVGALEDLADVWDVPVYAHELEVPYLDGTRSYTAPGERAGGSMLAALSPFFPHGPVNVGKRIHTLPADGSVPGMPGWRWIPTPGHTPGHVSLWHDDTRTIIAGDACITTKQESAYTVSQQDLEMHGPPLFYTEDREDARVSLCKLAALDPELVVTGHGRAMRGLEMRRGLHDVANNFDEEMMAGTDGSIISVPVGL